MKESNYVMIGSASMVALLTMLVVVPAFAAPGYANVVSSNVTPNKGGEINNYKVITSGNIPTAPDAYSNNVNDSFAYAWIAAVDCSQYEDSNCGGNHSRAVFAILDANAEQDNDNSNWHVVTGTFSIHPLDGCNGSQAVSLDLDNQLQSLSDAKIAIKGHKMSLTLDADSAPVTPANFTSATSMALFESPYGKTVMCVGSLPE